MPSQLCQYLLEFYNDGGSGNFLQKNSAKGASKAAIQIDDQDDGDSLVEFCNIYCTVTSSDSVRLELYGKFPITEEMSALAVSHGGFVNPERGRLVLTVTVGEAVLVDDLAQLVRGTARMGAVAGNHEWFRISARTVSSLLRFGRVLYDYNDYKKNN